MLKLAPRRGTPTMAHFNFRPPGTCKASVKKKTSQNNNKRPIDSEIVKTSVNTIRTTNLQGLIKENGWAANDGTSKLVESHQNGVRHKHGAFRAGRSPVDLPCPVVAFLECHTRRAGGRPDFGEKHGRITNQWPTRQKCGDSTNMYMYVYIYIYICRCIQRERERVI